MSAAVTSGSKGRRDARGGGTREGFRSGAVSRVARRKDALSPLPARPGNYGSASRPAPAAAAMTFAHAGRSGPAAAAPGRPSARHRPPLARPGRAPTPLRPRRGRRAALGWPHRPLRPRRCPRARGGERRAPPAAAPAPAPAAGPGAAAARCGGCWPAPSPGGPRTDGRTDVFLVRTRIGAHAR